LPEETDREILFPQVSDNMSRQTGFNGHQDKINAAFFRLYFVMLSSTHIDPRASIFVIMVLAAMILFHHYFQPSQKIKDRF
jgi:hypothetical protein